MKKALVLLFFCIMTTYAAPGLVINGTQFEYNGKRIFFSGLNLAWMDFNGDVGADPLTENAWRMAVQDIRAAGGNSIRWWLFNNMATSPTINTTTNLVSGLPANTINNIVKALDIAEEYGVMVSLCLFSHNLMEKDQWGNYNEKIPYDANRKLFTDDGIEAFIENALNPILEGVGDHNALWTWELFNEPEGMVQGWAGEEQTMDLLSIQKFSNRVAAAIHDYDATLLVSTGVNNAGALPTWSDEALIAAGGESNGTLDFLQVHFYPEHLDDSENPFAHAASKWGLTKPLVIGEFWSAGWDKEAYPGFKVSTKNTVELYEWAYEQGYAGALAWRYYADKDGETKLYIHDYEAAKPGMEALAAQYEEFIKIKDYTPPDISGNGVMQVTYTNVNSEATLEYVTAANLTGNSVVTFKVRTVNSPAFSLRLVVKSGDGWVWKDTDKMCDVPANGEWITCTYDLASDFSGVTLSDIKSFLIQTFNDGYSGVIQFDDIMAGTETIISFDKQFNLFKPTTDPPGGAAITKIETVYDGASSILNRQKQAQQRLNLSTLDFGTAKVYDIRGNRVSANSFENLKALPAGVYVVKTPNGKVLFTSK